MSKSGAQRLGDVAQLADAIRRIILAALRGGWQAALLEAAKRFWPYILVIVLVIIMLPVIIFCCLPSMMFGYDSTSDQEVGDLTAQAETIAGYYAQYEQYCTQRVEEIQDSVINDGEEEAQSSPDVSSSEDSEEDTSENVDYEVVIEGGPMEQNWFIALYSVHCGNDLRNMNEESIRSYVADTIPYTVTEKEEEEEAASSDPAQTVEEASSQAGESSSEAEGSSPSEMLLTITYLTPEQILESFSETDRNWAELMYKTLTGQGSSSSVVFPDTGTGQLASPFPDVDWRSVLTSGYGSRTDPITGEPGNFHTGIDLARPTGTGIYAAEAGTVITVKYNTTGYGYHVIIDHGNGLQTVYAHCSELLVSEGQQVQRGQLIAKVGETGRATGPHCHFEVRLDGEDVDPTGYLS